MAFAATTGLVVNRSTSEDVHVEVAGWTSASPAWVQHAVELLSEGGLVLLAAGVLVAGLLSWRRRDRRAVVASLAAAVVGAYGLSEVLKLLHEQPRPCTAVAVVRAVAQCPQAGDWSMPSNHATIAAALGTAVVFLVPRLWPGVLAVVAGVGWSRVALGVHYPHDVLDGLALGVAVVALAGGAASAVTRQASRETPDGRTPARAPSSGVLVERSSEQGRRAVGG